MQIECMLRCEHANPLPSNNDIFHMDSAGGLALFRRYGGREPL